MFTVIFLANIDLFDIRFCMTDNEKFFYITIEAFWSETF